MTDGDDPADGEPVPDQTGASGVNELVAKQVIDPAVAATAKDVLSTVVTSGTGQRAQNGEPTWGKTGTTDDNGDAWFCGATPDITACIWVGYRDTVTPMETEYAGGPVDGGTFPALIFSQIATAYEEVQALHAAEEEADEPEDEDDEDEDSTTDTSTTESTEAVTPTTESVEPRDPSRGRARRRSRRPRRRRPPTPATTVPPPRRPRAAASRPARLLAQAAWRDRRQRSREVRAPGGAEAPRQLGRLADPDSRPGCDLDPVASGRSAGGARTAGGRAARC